jgi:salicylate hydroxylase
MSGSGRTVFIAGAGIAGLTLALALAKFGASVIVLERHRAIDELGAGIQISPNARRVLNQLGLDRQIAAQSLEPAGIDIYPFRAAKPLVTLPLGPAVAERYGVPYAVMHRADLAEILHRACRRFANIDIVLGVCDFDVASHSRGISMTADEADGRARTGRGFAFVGADGVNSKTRTDILKGPEAEFSGYVAWRASLPVEKLEGIIALDRTSLLLGPSYHAVCYPLPQRKRVNIVLLAREKAAAAFGETLPGQPTLGRALLRSERFDAIGKAAEGAWGYWPIATVSDIAWHEDGVGLIGDAAHAMLPFQAQGAAMAIEDAAILAPLLMTEPTADSAFSRFSAMRRERIERVARLSRFNGFAFHMEWPFTLARNAALMLQAGSGHLRRLDWLYGFDIAPEVRTAVPARA